MDHDVSATEGGLYTGPTIVSYGSLIDMTAGSIGTDGCAKLDAARDFAGASPPFGDPVLCEHS